MTKEQRKKRIRNGTIIIAVVFVALISVLIKTQLVNGADYKEASSSLAVSKTTVKATRGEILDRNGDALVTNRIANTIVFKYSEFPSYKKQADRNKLIFSLITLFEKNKTEWIDNLPIVYNKNGVLTIDKDKEKEFKYMVSENMLELESGEKATADECLDALIERYGLEEYSRADARKIASVCFGMKYLSFSTSTNYTFADDVSTVLVSEVMENSATYPGVDTDTESCREYTDKTDFSHILGVVGSISAEEYDSEKAKLKEALSDDSLTKSQITTLENNAYSLNDTYGKSGIESAMESYLRGTNGIKTITTASDGSVSEDYYIKPVQGDTVVTTINAGLQKVATKALQSMLSSNRNSSYFGTAGAMVVENVKTGEILACVSLPSYDITKYFIDYSKLSADTESPLWNRALQSAYAPGSTMKPAMAIAGLEEKVITENTVFYCGSRYQCEDQVFNCLGSHGYLNVTTALQKSCNIFFFEVGKKLGIDRMNKYCNLLGLGQKTGIELSEVEGTLAGIANREESGGTWNPGDTVQAAIGQSDNLFTPIQLANYVSTIANGGTRLKPYMIKSILSADMSSVVYETQTEVLNTLNVSKKNLNIVKQGMHQVVQYGGCSSYFDKCVVDAGGKTGTSQVYRTTASGVQMMCNNGFFITFAPYDDPEIAIAIVAENASSGSGISPAAVEVYNYYFGQKNVYDTAEKAGTLIP